MEAQLIGVDQATSIRVNEYTQRTTNPQSNVARHATPCLFIDQEQGLLHHSQCNAFLFTKIERRTLD